MPSIVAVIRPDQCEPGETIADFVEDEGRPITALDAGGMNDDPQRQAFDINKGVNLAPLIFFPASYPTSPSKPPPFPPTSSFGCR